jgi:hypothetical protein
MTDLKDFGVDIGQRCPGSLYVVLLGEIGPHVAPTL